MMKVYLMHHGNDSTIRTMVRLENYITEFKYKKMCWFGNELSVLFFHIRKRIKNSRNIDFKKCKLALGIINCLE